jgi:phosphonate transport system substrate-binding protein
LTRIYLLDSRFVRIVLSFFLGFLFYLQVGNANSSPSPSESPESITIGLTPGGRPANLKFQSIEFAKQMQAELGVSVNIFISKDYESLIEAMKNQKIDFAFFSALTYVYAEERVHAKVLLKKVYIDPFYYSALISRKDSGIRRLAQLKGKRIVFVDSHSTSGYLYPQVMLIKKGIDQKTFGKILFSGNHSRSIEMLENNEADVAAVFSDNANGSAGAWTKFSNKPGMKYNIIWASEPIPSDPFAVRQDFYDKYPKFTHTLMMSLIDIFQKNKESKVFSEILGSQDLMPATFRQYDPVREMVKALNPVIK